MVYLWQNTDTGEIVEHDHWSTPPEKPGSWVRKFSFGVGRVEGGGGSPGRVSRGS